MKLKSTVLSILHDAETYLHPISLRQYTQPIPLLSNATIGQHTRHFIEFFQCLLQQLDEQCINYDHRKRNTQIEEDPAIALQLIHEIAERLPIELPDASLTLQTNYHTTQQQAIAVATNYERELLYNIEHTIHHLAIIKIGLTLVAPTIDLSPHFGIAPSTIRHRNAQPASK